jgi:hypothetical protein
MSLLLLVTMAEPLAVPKQLQLQLAKCKSIREPDYYKSREKTPAVRKTTLELQEKQVVMFSSLYMLSLFSYLAFPFFLLPIGNKSVKGQASSSTDTDEMNDIMQ